MRFSWSLFWFVLLQFTSSEFDDWFRLREYRRPMRAQGIDGDTFLLGLSLINGGNLWAEMLELVQYMMALGLLDAKTINGEVVYKLPQ